jgi:glycosyltransferase involved in cell wall biosynthesis
VSIHDLTYFVQPERCPVVRRRYWYAMTGRTVRIADRIITCSENSRRDIERFFPSARGRVEVIPYGLHPRYRRLERAPEESLVRQHKIANPYLLYAGTLEPGKNIVRIIQAFDALAEDFRDHWLVIAGDRGWLYQDIFKAARNARHADRIRFVGHLNDAEVVDFMNDCDAFVFPSLYEGFGLPPLEAMACGAPVVSSKTSSVPEVLGDAALLVDPRDERAIAESLRAILSDERLREDLRQRGAARARQFSWQRAAVETLRVYRSVIA